MTKYVSINSDYVYHINFMVDGELVEPTSATITITNNAGTVIGDFDEEEITIDGVSANIQISAADNQTSLVNEYRHIKVVFVYEGLTFMQEDFYFLAANTFFPLSPEEVLAVIGLTPGEVSITHGDILAAYDLVKVDAAPTNLDNILTGGSALLPHLIAAVKYKAALQISIGAQNSIMQMEQSDNTLYRRFMEVDFTSIDDKISRAYEAALFALGGSVVGEPPVLSIMIVGTDAVTGEG